MQMLSCGDGFTLAATVENELFFWGSKVYILTYKNYFEHHCQTNVINNLKKIFVAYLLVVVPYDYLLPGCAALSSRHHSRGHRPDCQLYEHACGQVESVNY